jgi:hypothetical protein
MTECVELPQAAAPAARGRPERGRVVRPTRRRLGHHRLARRTRGRPVGAAAAIWCAAGARQLVTGCVPNLLMISMVVLTVQTVAVIATGTSRSCYSTSR